jgi:hypothetical protein
MEGADKYSCSDVPVSSLEKMDTSLDSAMLKYRVQEKKCCVHYVFYSTVL